MSPYRSNLSYENTLEVIIENYTMYVRVAFAPGLDPELLSIEFEPAMRPEDLEFNRDIVVAENDTMGSVALRYLANAHVGGWWLEEELYKKL